MIFFKKKLGVLDYLVSTLIFLYRKREMGMTYKTDLLLEVGEFIDRIIQREDVLPGRRIRRRGMCEMTIPNRKCQAETFQILLVLPSQYAASPYYGGLRYRIEIVGVGESYSGSVMVPGNDKRGKVPHDVDTFIRICSIADKVTKANPLIHGLFYSIDYPFKGFLVGMYIRDETVSYLTLSLAILSITPFINLPLSSVEYLLAISMASLRVTLTGIPFT